MLKLSHPITSINGFKIGDKVRLKDGDGRSHIIKSFSIDGMKEFFFEVQFEDGAETMLDNIAPLTSDLDEAAEEYAKRHAATLLPLAIDARAKEMDEALEKSELDKDSIPYHLIEFMCNLYTCPNWKEIEETAELYVTRVKAAALKDFPRWKKVGADTGQINLYKGFLRAQNYLEVDGRRIMLSELEKLPGFKED